LLKIYRFPLPVYCHFCGKGYNKAEYYPLTTFKEKQNKEKDGDNIRVPLKAFISNDIESEEYAQKTAECPVCRRGKVIPPPVHEVNEEMEKL